MKSPRTFGDYTFFCKKVVNREVVSTAQKVKEVQHWIFQTKEIL